jgi:hypothetical protein
MGCFTQLSLRDVAYVSSRNPPVDFDDLMLERS